MSLLKSNIIVGNQVSGWLVVFDTRDYVNVLGREWLISEYSHFQHMADLSGIDPSHQYLEKMQQYQHSYIKPSKHVDFVISVTKGLNLINRPPFRVKKNKLRYLLHKRSIGVLLYAIVNLW